jgi:divalent metal cation (Fe/Co/Zn/Cd) transporter
MAIGIGILWESGLRLQHVEALAPFEWAAFWVAASALVVVVGIGGTLLGWTFLDLLAAALMGFMILRMGGQLAWGALKELIDTGLDAAQVGAIRATLLATPGVLGLHELRTRRMAHQALVDAHVQVDARISVSEGHRIAESARARVLREHQEVLDALVHIDPEDDLDPDLAAARLPARDALLAELTGLLAGLPAPDRIVLHYLGGRVEVEVFVSHDFLGDATALRAAEAALAERIRDHPEIRSISLNLRVAPI